MKIKLILIAVACILSGCISAQAQGQPCGCADKEELLNLLNVTQMEIQELNFQLNLITDQEKASGTPVMFSQDGYKKLMETLTNAERAVQKKGLGNGTVTMDSRTCSIKDTETGNHCVRQVRLIIHRVHQKACMEGQLERQRGVSYRTRMEMKRLVLEKIEAYNAAQEFILQMLKSLPKTCRPNNWFGYIVLQRVFTSVDEETIPPRPRSGPYGALTSGTRTTKKEDLEIGTVLVGDLKPMSIRAHVESTENAAYAASTEAFCGGAVGWKSATETTNFKSFLKGEDNGDVVSASNRTVLTVNPTNQTYNVYTGIFPRVNLSGQKVSSAKSAFAVCRNDPDPPDRTEPFTSSPSILPYSATNEKIKPGSSNYLEGSRVVRPPDFNKSYKQGNTLTTLTQEFQLRWMLVRLP